MAARQGGARSRPIAQRRDARRLSGVAPALPDQLPPTGAQNRAHRSGRGRCGADRAGLGEGARRIRQGRPIPLWPLQRGRRDVRAGGQSLSHLRRSGLAQVARLYERHHGAAGLEGLDRRRRGGRMAGREIRSGLTQLFVDLFPGRPRARVRSLAGRRIIAEGLEHSFWKDFYFNAMTATWPAFFGALAAGFIALNLLFACLYWLGADPIANAPKGDFSDLFFFSVETSSTVGYGDMHPQTFYGHAVATF